MSRITERINEILKFADSSKVTDKKRCVTELSNLYRNDEAVAEICQNTKGKVPGIANWPYIMHTVHKLAVNEAGRPGKETSAKNNERQAIAGLIVNTVRLSNERSAELLKSSEIVPVILQILDSNLYVHYEDTYLGILVTYILPKTANHRDITAEQWRELLLICTKLYKRTHLKKHIVLDALQMVVDYSFPHVNLLAEVKDLLLFLENIFQDVKTNNEQLAESFYKVSNSVCRQVATESRITLCKFSETILIDVLRLNGSEEKYKLLSVFLQIHHPNGISSCNDGAYAYNWNEWKDLLRSMCLLIQENCKLDVQWQSFIQFASEENVIDGISLLCILFIVAKQMVDSAQSYVCSLDASYDGSLSQSVKRRRTTIGRMENIIDLIMECSPDEVWPMSRILAETLKKYPQCLRPQDLAPLLQRLMELAQSLSRTNESTESIMDNVYKLAAVLMENEMSIGEVQDAAIHWSKIWDMLLRSVGANQNEETGHALIRCFIRYNRMPNINAFLRLYLTKAIRWSPNSVHTLLQLCKRVSLSEDATATILNPSPSTTPICDRTRLLEWLLNVPWQKLTVRSPVDDLCALSVDIILSSRCRQNVRTKFTSSQDLRCSRNSEETRTISSMQQDILSMDLPRLCYSFLTFRTNLLANLTDVEIKSNVMFDSVPVHHVQEALNFLKKRLHDTFQDEDSNDEVYVVLMKLAFLARLLSTLRQLGILTEDTANCSLVSILENHLAKSFETLEKIDSARCKYAYLVNVIKALNVLYGGVYNTDIARIIVSASTVNILRNIFDLLNIDDSQAANYGRSCEFYEERGSYQERRRRSVASEMSSAFPSQEGAIRLRVVEALASYCALHIGEDKSALQTKMMRMLLTMQQDFTSCIDSKMSLMILAFLVRRDHSEIQREYADAPLEFLLRVCEKDRKTEESLRRLLSLLPSFFEYATKYDYSPKRVIETLSSFYKRIHKRNYGILVHSDYMKCVCNVVRIDPYFMWSASISEAVTMMLDSILSYIGHTLFILRAQAVRCLQELLSFGNIPYKWKEYLFIKVEETVLDLLNVDQQLEPNSQNSLQECQQRDDKETRTATALTALASVACANGVLQGRALRAMLRLIAERKVKVQKMQQILSTIARQTKYISLIENNLNYLLTFWIDAKYSLENFPWALTGCDTANEFFEKYISYIVPLLFRTSELDKVVLFCNSVGIIFANIFEKIFPSCFVWLISRVCDPSVSSIDSIPGQILKKLLKNTDEFASTRSFNRLFVDRLNDVLVELVQRLHDEAHFEHLFSLNSITFPEVDPPHLSAATIAQCFVYLEQTIMECSLTRVLVEQQPAALQKTLLQLVDAMHSSRSNEDRLKRLHQYSYFCSLLMRDMDEPFFDKMAPFFIRDVCYSLLHLTRSADDVLSTTCCKFLDLFLRRALRMRAAEVQDILRFVVANLIGLAQTENSAEIALNLLELLIIERSDVLCEASAKLGSFPSLEIFREIRNAHNTVRYGANKITIRLEDELERFLDATNDENPECMLEDLANLARLLSTRKKELKELFRKPEKPYLENGASTLYQVIFRLVKLTESANPCVSMEAAKCLGELGPTDSMVALRPAGNLVREANHAIEALTYRSVAMLTNFLVENVMNLRKISADALYAVLSTTYGKKLSDPEYTRDLSNILHECAPFKMDYIRPFVRSRCLACKSFSLNMSRFPIVMDPGNRIWTVGNDKNYVDWLVETTCAIAECFVDSYLESFLPVCRMSVEFCELILPRIIYLIFERCESSIDTMCDCFNRFFRYHFAINQDAEIATLSTSLPESSCDRKIVRRMLDIVNHMRTQLPDSVTLKLDYIYLARAAHECCAYYTALLFAQLACESFSTEYPDFSSDPKIDYIYKRQPQFGRVLQDIMQDTYLNISDPDAICGAGSSYLLEHNSRIQYYARTNSWDKVTLAQDIELSYGNPLAAREMASALHYSGLQFLQWQFLSGNKDLDEKFSYECAWRLGNWDLIVDNAATDQNDLAQLRLSEKAFNQHHYHALKCFHEDDQKGTERAIECARKSIIHCLKVVSLESSRTVNEKLSQLRLLCEIEQLGSPDLQEYSEVLRRWDEHEILNGQFEYVEPILQQRITMFRIKDSLKADANVQKAFFDTCLNLAIVAEAQGNFPVAARALGTLTKHQNLSEDLQNQLLYQEALLAWMKCDQIVARRLLRSLIEKKNLRPNLRTKALRVYGDWMAETKSENPQAVIEKYYLESIKTSESIEEQTPDVIRNLDDTQVALARFADAQYEQISTYMKSSTYESLKEYVRTAVKIDKPQMLKNRDIKRALIISEKQSTNDAAELNSIEQERRNYLLQALKYYLRTLQRSEEHNLLIFRLVALWLDNMFDEEVNELLDELDTVPSFKFVPLVPQLAAHVSNDLKSGFSKRIFEILERCALEHPYHTLPVMLALKNLHSDNDYDSSGTVVKEERRVLGARMLLKRMLKSPVETIVREMEILSRALVELAYWQPRGKAQGKHYHIPHEQPISKIKDLNNVLLPTLSLPVRPSGNYKDVIGVRAYRDTCEFVGGVNAPKKIICVGTDGVQRRQLVKSKDDLRQDAVMQQMFTVMNTLLGTCKETRRRNLKIRTYKVVPLTQRSGVLEWCDNTVPITEILVGSSDKTGIHKKYHPRDMTVETARNKMRAVGQDSNETKLKVFLEVCRHMRPAFHHFFEEKYLSPETWVERTLTYTRSVATTSIAGYILGLGDRHLSNILIDERTAEVVHIDFGVAFEQGKVLPIPECIPFRLTRDIEVAMGASGIEGTMRRSCEATMTMLREQRQIIITLLQVLLYDPLFTWAITPEKACKMQSDIVKGISHSDRTPVETNKIAKRALLRVEQKLRGTEDGLVSSVSGQVERLLQEARDPANLCRIYCGWQPYL